VPYSLGAPSLRLIVPEEIVLATRLELGLASRDELSDLVDRHIAETSRLDGVLLELATPLDMAVDDLSSRLEALAGVTKEHGAAMRVVIVADLVAREILTIERAVDYLAVRAAPSLPPPLDADCGALDDMVWLAKSGTYETMDSVRERLAEIAAACAIGSTDA